MACELLICNFEKNGWKPGYVVAIKDTPCRWGPSELTKDWKIVRIDDRKRTELENTFYKHLYKESVEKEEEESTMVGIRKTSVDMVELDKLSKEEDMTVCKYSDLTTKEESASIGVGG